MCRANRGRFAEGDLRISSRTRVDAVGCGFPRGGERHSFCRDAQGKRAASGFQAITAHL
jgi:hypothetical protein